MTNILNINHRFQLLNRHLKRILFFKMKYITLEGSPSYSFQLHDVSFTKNSLFRRKTVNFLHHKHKNANMFYIRRIKLNISISKPDNIVVSISKMCRILLCVNKTILSRISVNTIKRLRSKYVWKKEVLTTKQEVIIKLQYI